MKLNHNDNHNVRLAGLELEVNVHVAIIILYKKLLVHSLCLVINFVATPSW